MREKPTFPTQLDICRQKVYSGSRPEIHLSGKCPEEGMMKFTSNESHVCICNGLVILYQLN